MLCMMWGNRRQVGHDGTQTRDANLGSSEALARIEVSVCVAVEVLR